MNWWQDFRQQKLVDQLLESLEHCRKASEHRREEERKRLQYDFPLGTKIMVIPNHPCELIVGEVVGHTEICKSRQVVPLSLSAANVVSGIGQRFRMAASVITVESRKWLR
jgi:hypothetical protein